MRSFWKLSNCPSSVSPPPETRKRPVFCFTSLEKPPLTLVVDDVFLVQ